VVPPSTGNPGNGAIIRLQAIAGVTLLGAAVATYLLVTGWTSDACFEAANGRPNASCAAVTWGLIGAALLVSGLAIYSAIRDRKKIMAAPLDHADVVARGVRGVRWSAVFAIGLSVLLFADCSGSVVSSTGGSMADPARFWSLAPWLLIPLVVVLAVPAALATTAQLQLARQLPSSLRIASLAMWSTALVVVVGVTTAGVGLVFGIPACYLFSTGPGSPSTCAAGLGGIANILSSVGSIAVLLPYLLMVRWAIGRTHAEPS
jgi:hypothetical protein